MFRKVAGAFRRSLLGAPYRLGAALGIYRGQKPKVQFVTENADWAIRWVGEHIRDEIEKLSPETIDTTTKPYLLANNIVHFGSQYMWLSWRRHLSRSNRYVVSFFHGKREDGEGVSRHIDAFIKSEPRLGKIVTAASLVEERLVSWGIPREKIARIPIGVDTKVFSPVTKDRRIVIRKEMGIPDGATVIGSFQKDGVGWGDGMEPKLIKGPDIFLKAIEGLKKELNVFVVLTGPARGYVKQGLERLDVPYVHKYVKHHIELVRCFHALDLYFVTSREEGGPMGLMEGMASGIPVISTYVGMAPDLILDGVTGGLVSSEKGAEIASRALEILATPESQKESLIARAREKVMECDWQVVGRRHLDEVYRPLMNDEI